MVNGNDCLSFLDRTHSQLAEFIRSNEDGIKTFLIITQEQLYSHFWICIPNV